MLLSYRHRSRRHVSAVTQPSSGPHKDTQGRPICERYGIPLVRVNLYCFCVFLCGPDDGCVTAETCRLLWCLYDNNIHFVVLTYLYFLYTIRNITADGIEPVCNTKSSWLQSIVNRRTYLTRRGPAAPGWPGREETKFQTRWDQNPALPGRPPVSPPLSCPPFYKDTQKYRNVKHTARTHLKTKISNVSLTHPVSARYIQGYSKWLSGF